MPLKLERDDQTTINLTPMIDIVFLLIIFFMVSTKFSELNEVERDLSINVPTVANATALTSAPKKRVIEVFSDGSIKLDQESISLADLETKLDAAQKQYRKLGVVVRGDGRSAYQCIADVLATCRKARITDLNLKVREASRVQSNSLR
jgi:biopolymer transport protein ExbD